MTPERARAMLAALVEDLPPERRDKAVRELVARLVESYCAAGAVPDWLERINKACSTSALQVESFHLRGAGTTVRSSPTRRTDSACRPGRTQTPYGRTSPHSAGRRGGP